MILHLPPKSDESESPLAGRAGQFALSQKSSIFSFTLQIKRRVADSAFVMTELIFGLGELVKGIIDLSSDIKSSASEIQSLKRYLEDSYTLLSHLQEVLVSTEPEVKDSSIINSLEVQIVHNAQRCTTTVKKTQSVLRKYESKSIGKSVKWAVLGRKEFIKLRQDLENLMEPLKASVQILLLQVYGIVKSIIF